MIADSAAGYAASTLTGADTEVLTVEYKLNLLAPADGQLLIAEGSVVRYGRTLIVTKAEVCFPSLTAKTSAFVTINVRP